MIKILRPASLLIVALIINQLAFAGDPDAGKAKSQICAACHGVDGNSTNPAWPSLAGQHEEYIIKQLTDFKSGDRQNAQMSPMASPLTKDDIDDLAAYFAAQKPQKNTADPVLIEKGEQLYRAGGQTNGLAACMACHGPNGAGNPAAGYPVLSGQHADYTAAQLKAFKAESRSNDINSVMRIIAGKMTNDEIESVSSYIQGLQ